MSKTYHGWMNVYRSGWFHREGKPGDCNRHGGDLYLDYETALQAIDPPSHYIGTVAVSWEDQDDLTTNAADSVPTPLSASRKAFAATVKESQQ